MDTSGPMEQDSAAHNKESDHILTSFIDWDNNTRVSFLQKLVGKLNRNDQIYLSNALSPLVRCDLLTRLPPELALKILFYLDAKSLFQVALVSKDWRDLQNNRFFWKKIVDSRKAGLDNWRLLYKIRQAEFGNPESVDWKGKFISFDKDLERLKENWRNPAVEPQSSAIECNGNGIYCLQYDDEKIVTGSRDNLVKIWGISDRKCVRQLQGHQGSVLCLQFDDKKVISGSSDGTVRVWDIESGECKQTLTEHTTSVLHLKFLGDQLVTCSKDKRVMLWQLDAHGQYILKRQMRDHKAAVNVVEFDANHIVSASGDRTVRIWDTETGDPIKVLKGHMRGIACLQLRGDTIVTGSSDQRIMRWSISDPSCTPMLQYLGHEELVRCVRFNDSYIVSGSYDRTVRIWDFNTAACLRTLHGHVNRVFRVQFDDFKIVSSSQDDQIKIWDFYSPGASGRPSIFGAPPREAAAHAHAHAPGHDQAARPGRVVDDGGYMVVDGNDHGPEVLVHPMMGLGPQNRARAPQNFGDRWAPPGM